MPIYRVRVMGVRRRLVAWYVGSLLLGAAFLVLFYVLPLLVVR